jgi:hypothetical protein
MSCQIFNNSKTCELIPNGSPRFLTTATRNTWHQFQYSTSVLKHQSRPVAVKPAAQPKLSVPVHKKALGDASERKKNRKKKRDNAAHSTQESHTINWWNNLGIVTKETSRDKRSALSMVKQETNSGSYDVVDSKRNELPIPETILGAFGGDAILVRLRSVDDSDLMVCADHVSFCYVLLIYLTSRPHRLTKHIFCRLFNSKPSRRTEIKNY